MSLPVRECGLKLKSSCHIVDLTVSLPVRECGLKLDGALVAETITESLPVRECGLKQNVTPVNVCYDGHSPCGSVD